MFREFVLVAVLLLGIAATQDLSLNDVDELENFNIEIANLTVTQPEKPLFAPHNQKRTKRYRMGILRFRK